MTFDELQTIIQKAAATMKLVCGVANNAAILVMYDAYDKVRQHPRFKHAVKKAYNDAIATHEAYERNLLYADTNRFFHVEDMPPEIRKKYGDITDADYFEFWQCMGGTAYKSTYPLITSLWNKYRLSLNDHKIPNAEIIAWPMTAHVCLEMACSLYKTTVTDICDYNHLPHKVVNNVFDGYNLKPVADKWRKALDITEPMISYKLDNTEYHNIGLGIEQIYDAWSHPDLYYDATIDTINDFGDIFRTKGEQKKALREISEAVNEERN